MQSRRRISSRWQPVPASLADCRHASIALAAAAAVQSRRRSRAAALREGEPPMPDVLLGQAYYLRFDPKLWQAQQPYAPLGTLYAAAHLRARGHSVALFDAMLADSASRMGRRARRAPPRLAVIYEDSFNYLTKMCLLRMRQAALTMIDQRRARGVPVIVSGSDATDHPESICVAGAAAVILGEGEVTLAELVDSPEARPPDRRRPGPRVSGRCGRGAADAVAAVRQVARRAAVPRVGPRRRRALPRLWRSRHGYYSMNIATTRGCPFHCNWCAKPIYGQRYAVRSPSERRRRDRVAARAVHPISSPIVDDVFGLQPGWVEEFAALCRRQGARLPFRCLMRADQVSPDVGARWRRPAAAWCGWAPSRDRNESSTRWRRAARRADPRSGPAPAGGGHRRRTLPAVRLPGRGRGTTSRRRSSSCARSRRRTSACRCRIRCRAPSSTSACAPSSATSRTGSTPTIWR